jgi:hypothetical protein
MALAVNARFEFGGRSKIFELNLLDKGIRYTQPNLGRPFCVQDIDIKAGPFGCVASSWYYLVGIQGSKGANVIDGEVGVDVGALSIPRDEIKEKEVTGRRRAWG